MSPTARSLAWFRVQKRHAQVVEKWVAPARRRVDLFGCIDLVVIEPLTAIVGVQVTTTGHLADRLTKMRVEHGDVMRAWLAAGGRLLLHGWSLKGARGRAKRWTLTERPVTAGDLEVV